MPTCAQPPPGFRGTHPEEAGGPNPGVPALRPPHQAPHSKLDPLQRPVGAARLPFAGAGGPAAAEGLLPAEPAGEVTLTARRSARLGQEGARSSGPSQLSWGRSPPGALGSESRETASRKLFPVGAGGAGAGGEEGAAPAGFPRRLRVPGSRGGAGRGRGDRPRLRLRGEVPAPRRPHRSGQRRAPRRAGRGRGRG